MLLLDSDERRRRELAEALRTVRLPVLSVASIAEVERWPVGDLVVTDAAHFTPWWKKVGATHVIVIAASRREGEAACALGATAWVASHARPTELVRIVQRLLQAAGSTVVPSVFLTADFLRHSS
jgi:CheY-like chemotaxis protein